MDNPFADSNNNNSKNSRATRLSERDKNKQKLKKLFNEPDFTDELLDSIEQLIFEKANNSFKSKEQKSFSNECEMKLKGPRNAWIRSSLIKGSLPLEAVFSPLKEIEEAQGHLKEAKPTTEGGRKPNKTTPHVRPRREDTQVREDHFQDGNREENVQNVDGSQNVAEQDDGKQTSNIVNKEKETEQNPISFGMEMEHEQNPIQFGIENNNDKNPVAFGMEKDSNQNFDRQQNDNFNEDEPHIDNNSYQNLNDESVPDQFPNNDQENENYNNFEETKEFINNLEINTKDNSTLNLEQDTQENKDSFVQTPDEHFNPVNYEEEEDEIKPIKKGKKTIEKKPKKGRDTNKHDLQFIPDVQNDIVSPIIKNVDDYKKIEQFKNIKSDPIGLEINENKIDKNEENNVKYDSDYEKEIHSQSISKIESNDSFLEKIDQNKDINKRQETNNTMEFTDTKQNSEKNLKLNITNEDKTPEQEKIKFQNHESAIPKNNIDNDNQDSFRSTQKLLSTATNEDQPNIGSFSDLNLNNLNMFNEEEKLFTMDQIKSKDFKSVDHLISQSNEFMNSLNDNLNDSFRSVRSLRNLNLDTIKLSQEYETLKVKYNVLKKNQDVLVKEKRENNTNLQKKKVEKLTEENQILINAIKSNDQYKVKVKQDQQSFVNQVNNIIKEKDNKITQLTTIAENLQTENQKFSNSIKNYEILKNDLKNKNNIINSLNKQVEDLTIQNNNQNNVLELKVNDQNNAILKLNEKLKELEKERNYQNSNSKKIVLNDNNKLDRSDDVEAYQGSDQDLEDQSQIDDIDFNQFSDNYIKDSSKNSEVLHATLVSESQNESNQIKNTNINSKSNVNTNHDNSPIKEINVNENQNISPTKKTKVDQNIENNSNQSQNEEDFFSSIANIQDTKPQSNNQSPKPQSNVQQINEEKVNKPQSNDQQFSEEKEEYHAKRHIQINKKGKKGKGKTENTNSNFDPSAMTQSKKATSNDNLVPENLF